MNPISPVFLVGVTVFRNTKCVRENNVSILQKSVHLVEYLSKFEVITLTWEIEIILFFAPFCSFMIFSFEYIFLLFQVKNQKQHIVKFGHLSIWISFEYNQVSYLSTYYTYLLIW